MKQDKNSTQHSTCTNYEKKRWKLKKFKTKCKDLQKYHETKAEAGLSGLKT